jgi:hypothetical protein
MLEFGSRGLSVLSHSLTALSVLVGLLALTSMYMSHPAPIIHSLVAHPVTHFAQRGDHDVALFSMDLHVDATPFFNSCWNCKQAYVYVVAQMPDGHEAIVLDMIISPHHSEETAAGRPTKVFRGTVGNFKEQRIKAPLFASQLVDKTVTFGVRYEALPFVGVASKHSTDSKTTLQLPAQYTHTLRA